MIKIVSQTHILSYNNWSHTHTHTRLMALFPGLPRWAGTRKAKPIWILLKQETVSGSGISWNICKSAPRPRQITMPAPHHSSFFTGRMPFLPPNQQRQSTEGNRKKREKPLKKIEACFSTGQMLYCRPTNNIKHWMEPKALLRTRKKIIRTFPTVDSVISSAFTPRTLDQYPFFLSNTSFCF